jgi:EmrB/QacA subfamily drug resistance transporter
MKLRGSLSPPRVVVPVASKVNGPWPGRAPSFELTRQQKVFTLTGVLLGMLLAALDQTIVATAGPAIQHDLAMPAALYAWITTAYMVASTVLVPIYGKLSDNFGRKPILLVGIILFLFGSLLCGLSESSATLILSRAVQGLGSAALFTSAFAVVADIFPPAVRGKFTGVFGAVWGLSSVVGPFLGGFLTDNFGWHWVFFVNLPVGTIAILFIVAKMPWLGSPGRARHPIDIAGALTLIGAVVPLLLGLSLGHSQAAMAISVATAGTAAVGYPWLSWQVLGLFGAAAIAGGFFVMVERRARDPILDFGLFANPVFAWGNAAVFVVGASFFAGIVFLPLFMVNVVGLSATQSGLTLTPLTLGLVAGNIGSGQLVTRFGRYRPLLLMSLALLMGAFAIMAITLDPRSTQTGTTLKMILVGIGLGPTIPLYTLAIQNAVLSQQIGVATASATFFRQMGATVGVAMLGTVFANELSAGLVLLTHGVAQTHGVAAFAPPSVLMGFKEAFSAAIRQVYWVGFGVVGVGMVLTARIPELPLRNTL